MTKGKTTRGFEYKIDEGRLANDYRFTLALAKTNSHDPVKQAEADIILMTALLGNEQFDKLIEFATLEDGTVSREIMTETSKEIFTALESKTKN